MVNDKLKKAEQLAKDKTEEINKSVEEKAAEVKKETESTEAGKKTEGDKSIVEKAEKQAEDDTRIISAKEEELSEEDKTRKVEIEKAKEKKEETIEEREQRIKDSTQQRINEVISDLKAEKAERKIDKEKIANLESTLETLTKPKAEESKTSKVKELFDQQVSTYLNEDKEKPKEERREMSGEDLEEWLLEDYISATEWMVDRNIRRREEKESLTKSLEVDPKKEADEFLKAQKESLRKLIAKYPDAAPKPERLAELKGKTRAEIDEILASENEDYAMMLEIVKTDTKKYLESVDGPEQVMVEMERRKGKDKKTITLTEEELQQKISEAAVVEAQRLANLDEGITSSGGKKVEKKENKTEFRLKQEEIARKAGITIEKLDEAIQRRETIGVVTSTAEEFNKD